MKRILHGGAYIEPALADLGLTLVRVAAGVSLALAHGVKKVPVSDDFVNGVEDMGFPAPVVFAWAAALAELAGGFLLAAGLLTRLAALSIAFTMGIALFVRHASDAFAVKELALLYGLAALVFLFVGAGRLSLDRALLRRGS